MGRRRSRDSAAGLPGPAPHQAGTVGSLPAIFWDLDSSGNPAGVLLKLPDGRFVDVATAGLSKDEPVHVAASLTPAVPRPSPSAN